jgi:hypothetical protein
MAYQKISFEGHMKFSERIGAVRRVLQKESMDEGLKNALWNLAYVRYWSHYANKTSQPTADVTEGRLLAALWTEHFNKLRDELPLFFSDAFREIKRHFLASGWESVYDFVEFIANCGFDASSFIADCNRVLKKHVSAYRFVGTSLAPVTSDEEIVAVEEAASHGGRFSTVAFHIETALLRLADRINPDYRNSIKESISAVEAACQTITNNKSASIGQALKALGIHPALERGFSAIYGYTSDAQGIRHALSEEPNVGADDAKFFLVSCSAFTNYLIARSTSTPATD